MEIELALWAVYLERNGSQPHIIHKNTLRMYLKNFWKAQDTITKLKRHMTDWGEITSTYAVEAFIDFYLTDSPY